MHCLLLTHPLDELNADMHWYAVQNVNPRMH